MRPVSGRPIRCFARLRRLRLRRQLWIQFLYGPWWRYALCVPAGAVLGMIGYPCCCTAGGPTPGTDCEHCDAAFSTALEWEVTISGVVNDLCAKCAIWNTTWILPQDFTLFCEWETGLAIGDGCSTIDAPFVRISATIGKTLVLICADNAGGGAAGQIVQYAVDTSPNKPNCFTSHVLSFVSKNLACDNWPTSLTIIPV